MALRFSPQQTTIHTFIHLKVNIQKSVTSRFKVLFALEKALFRNILLSKYV